MVAYFHECSRRGGGCRRDRLLFAFVLVAYVLVFSFLLYSVPYYSPSPKQRPFLLEFIGIGSSSSNADVVFPCAINFYGLPRSFKSLVLPFVIQNVLLPNAPYNCDFFIHHHIRDMDPGGRDGRSGTIDPEDIFLLKEAIQAVHYTNANAQTTQRRNVPPPPLVVFANTTEEDFQRQYKSFLHEIHTARGPDGNLLYAPYRHPSYKKDTIDNVIKMWHGQESVWNLMVTASESSSWSHHHNHQSQQQQQSPKHYSRVAMLRSDVVYVTPIDIFKIPARQKEKQQQQRKNNKKGFFSWLMTRWTKDKDNGSAGWDWDNSVAVIPNFARHPVNDRMIYGPFDAVKIWASERFLRLPRQHLQNLQQQQQQQHGHNNNSNNTATSPSPSTTTSTGITLQQGDGIHSERFLCFTIFPAIRNAGIEIRNDPDLCFLRARADESIRFSDCDFLDITQNNHEFIETVLNHHHHHGIGIATTTITTGEQQQQQQQQQRQSCLLNTIDRDRKLVQLECSKEHLGIQHDSINNTDVRQARMTLEWQKMSPVNNISWHKGCDPINNKGWRKASCLKQHEAWLLAV